MADVRRKRPWWMWALGAVVGMIVLSALFGDDDKRSPSAPAASTLTIATATTPAVVAAASGPSMARSRAAVDAGRYAAALSLAAELSPDLREAIRRRIANRIARRALALVHAGALDQARVRLRQAARFPTTALTRQARSSYRSARSRAAARARRRRQAVARRARAAAAARAARARIARQSAASSCDPSYSGACLDPDSPDYDCAGGSGNGPDYTGTVTVVGDDHFGLDRNGDGTGCDP